MPKADPNTEYIVKSGERRSKASWEQRKQAQSEWHQRNRERRSSEAKARYYKTPEKAKDAYLKYEFGITLEDFNRMLELQYGVCAICFRPESQKSNKGNPKALAVDHCHTTGNVRGLLCAACNQAVGLLQDDPLRADALAKYLRESNG